MHARENGSLVELSVYCGDGECSGHSLPVVWVPGMIRKPPDKGKQREREKVRET